ncbi:MAG: PAS domain S-box protein [bacterium]
MASDNESVAGPPSDVRSSADERYRPLFALSPQPAWVFDAQTLRFLEVNDAAVRNYGWSRDEFLSMTIRDIRPPSEQARLVETLAAVPQGEIHATTALHRTRSGELHRVEINSFPLDLHGRAARMVIVNDVTERDEAAEALVKSEEKYRSVIEQLQDVFFRTDADGHWTFLNHAWTALTANTVESSIGTYFLNYVHPSDRRTLLDAFRPLTERAMDSMTVEIRYFRRGGGYLWMEARTHAVLGDDGRFIGTMGTLRDVTERRAADEERLRLATNIRQLMDASGEGIYGLDAHGAITFVNRRGSEMLGYSADELIGQSMHGFTHHSKPDGTPYPREECPIWAATSRGVACEVDDEVLWRKDGSPLQVEYAAFPVREQGQLAGAVVNFRDITLRKRAELELIVARDAAEAASRAKSDFLARMSHELRTPLNSIIGFANVLLKNRQGTLKPDELTYLSRIATNGSHLLGLINDILDLSKIEAGRMTLDVSPVSLETLVRETIDELESQTRDRPVVLRAELPARVRQIQTDWARMKQVIINLVGNALKFTESGEVVVTVEVDADDFPRHLKVRDTGIGIPKNRLDAIFNVFEQAESMTARRFGGTGLGLAISRSLCDLMGHHLDVNSVEGAGTTMDIRLGDPARAPRRSSPRSMPAIPADPAGRPSLHDAEGSVPTVLVVDDDADARHRLGELIEEAGYRVVYAGTGIEALRMSRELAPAMVFLDLMLPRISGFDVLRILQADEELKRTPVVIVSAVGSESRTALGGATAILDKPVEPEQIRDLLRIWIPSNTR